MKLLSILLLSLPFGAMAQSAHAQPANSDESKTLGKTIIADKTHMPEYGDGTSHGKEPNYCYGTLLPHRLNDTIQKLEILAIEELQWEWGDCSFLYIRNLNPYNDVNDFVAISVNAYQSQRGAPVIAAGCRPEEMLYIIDGMQVARR